MHSLTSLTDLTQALTEIFWRRFASEVAPAIFNRTGVSVMIGEADVWGTDGPPFDLPQWLKAAVPDYPLPLTVEVWGGHTLERNGGFGCVGMDA